jgi:hypothetical protein
VRPDVEDAVGQETALSKQMVRKRRLLGMFSVDIRLLTKALAMLEAA